MQATASVTAQNFLQPADDLGFRVDYKHPYLWGAADPNKTALNATAFNSRKLSGVFTPGTLAGLCCPQPVSHTSGPVFSTAPCQALWFPGARHARYPPHGRSLQAPSRQAICRVP